MSQDDLKPVEVTQADRIGAADLLDEISNLIDHNGLGQIADLIRDGEYDDHEAVQAFARHRLNTRASPLPAGEVGEAFRAWQSEPHDHVADDEEHQLLRFAFEGGWSAGLASQQKLISRLIMDADEEKERADEALATPFPATERELIDGVTVDAREIERLSEPHEGRIADWARNIASWTEQSTGRGNVYVTAKTALARAYLYGRASAPLQPEVQVSGDLEALLEWLTSEIDGAVMPRVKRLKFREIEATIEHLDSELGRATIALSESREAHGITLSRVEHLTAQVARMKEALARLGSSEAMTVPFVIDDTPTGEELKARIDFARQAISNEGEEK